MESSGPAEKDIKEECVEVVSEIDAESVVTVEMAEMAEASMFMSGEDEVGSDNSGVYMTDTQQQETLAGSNDTVVILERREVNMNKPERETILSLIEMVRNQPEIWDHTNGAYREPHWRRRTFRKIAEVLGWSTEDVVKKYNNLRTYYTKEVIKQKRSPTYRSKWPYFNQLDSFLRRTIHKRPAKVTTANKWARLAGRTTPGQDNSIQIHGAAGLRRNIRPRSNFNRVAATVSTPPVETSSNQLIMPSIGSSVGGSLTNQVSISHVRSLNSRQQQTQQQASNRPISISSTLPAIQPRPLPTQLQQIQSQLQNHPQQSQLQQRPKSPPNTTAPVTVINPNQQSSSSLPSQSSGQSVTEGTDAIFGRLVSSQLAKIPEGQKKEQLKIKVMQLLVEAMFDKEQS
ncbi:uncharacterized protein LOC129256514 [Lytechinus pictus]|uniref:uncharacterized protein LOC129256514 n=1 Tax=Lytechinus pictus TaxID=7653 RepID=UPI0030BA1126